MSWSTDPSPPAVKPGWTTDPALPTPVITQEWAVKFARRFALSVSPEIGMSATARIAASLGLAVTPEIGMAAAGRSSAEFTLAVSPQIGMALPPPIPADFTLAATPSIGMTAAEHYARAFQLAANPALGFVAAERYARSFGLEVTPQLGVVAQQRFAGSFSLTATPTLGFTAAKAPVRFDNASDGGSGGTTTRSWPHTLTGNCLIVLFTNSTSSAASCTYGGVPIPRIFGPSNSGTVFPANGYCSVFALVSNSLPQGENTISCTNAGTASAAGAVSFRNAGAIGTIVSDTASGNINKTVNPGAGGAAVAGYGGGGVSFGAISPNEAMRYGFSPFVTWPTVLGWGLDTGGGITFTATQSSSKAGAVVPILPAT